MPSRAAEEIRDANVRYHDLASSDYDAKWGIDYGPAGLRQVVGKVRKALGREPGRFERSLEIGAGTGYFTLNLLRAGVIGRAVATDISQGMLDSLEQSAARLGVEVETQRCEAQSLPFPDESFDLVLGHAVLHHLPDLDAAFREFRRVLRPGGMLVFCGEPSRYGDRIAGVGKRAAMRAAPAWRRAFGLDPRPNGSSAEEHEEHALEWAVDVHAFTPADLTTHARQAGFEEIRVSGEELASSWFGWINRTLESTADPKQIPASWIRYAYRGYLALQSLDRAALEGRLPPAIFYNLLISAQKPRQGP